MNAPHMAFFYSQFIKPGDLTFDIGAGSYSEDESCGDRTQIFRLLAAEVVAVDSNKGPIDFMAERFKYETDAVHLVNAVVGKEHGETVVFDLVREGRVVMVTSSDKFMEFCNKTKMFGDGEWQPRKCPAITLDSLIDTYGLPTFVKIDVEACEHLVIAGLSRPLKSLSFEFHPWNKDSAFEVIDRLTNLGTYLFNYCLREELKFCLETWVGPTAMKTAVEGLEGDLTLYGDIYARRYVNGEPARS